MGEGGWGWLGEVWWESVVGVCGGRGVGCGGGAWWECVVGAWWVGVVGGWGRIVGCGCGGWAEASGVEVGVMRGVEEREWRGR